MIRLRLVASVFALLSLLVAACGTTNNPTTAGPATLTLKAGRQEKSAASVDYLAFYPTSLKARAGDTVRFSNASLGTPHTITFGVAEDGSNHPAPVIPGKGTNPLVFGPCITDQPIKPTDTACPGAPPGGPPPASPPPEVKAPADFSGQSFYNSGAFFGTQTLVMKIADSVKSGDYRFVCLLHPTMVGKLSIVAKSSAIQDQATLDSSGDSLFASDKSNAQQLLASAPSPASTAQAGAVQAGVVGKELAINQFFPAQVSVRAGGTVTWNNTSFEPHTVTFGKALTFSDAVLFGPPIQPAAGVASSTTFAFSGFIGGKPFPASTFSLRFSKAGTYSYTCSIHPGMAGTVVVT